MKLGFRDRVSSLQQTPVLKFNVPTLLLLEHSFTVEYRRLHNRNTQMLSMQATTIMYMKTIKLVHLMFSNILNFSVVQSSAKFEVAGVG